MVAGPAVGAAGGIAECAVSSIFGFTANLLGQAAVYKSVDMGQALASGAGGFSTSLLGAGFGQGLGTVDKEIAVGLSYLSTDLGLSLGTSHFTDSSQYDFSRNSGNSTQSYSDEFSQSFQGTWWQ